MLISHHKRETLHENEVQFPGFSLVQKHGRRFFVLEHQYGRCDVMWKRSIRAIDHIFYGYETVINPLGMLGEHKKIYGSWFARFLSVPPTSRVGLLRRQTHRKRGLLFKYTFAMT